MHQCQYPIFPENETVYISAFGLEMEGKNASWGPGRRAECIVHYVLSGQGWFNGNPVHENQGFYIESSQLVEYYPDPDNPWTYFWIDCSKEFSDRYLRQTLPINEYGIFDYNFKSKLLSIIDKVMKCDHNMGVVESFGFAFSILMQHMPKSEVISKSQLYVRQAKSYIDSNINKRLTVFDVAEAISINDRYLYSLFMKYEGIPPKEYILKRKLETAADLLESTDMPVMEIAAVVGFSDIYSFSKAFKSKYNLPPTKYRCQMK